MKIIRGSSKNMKYFFIWCNKNVLKILFPYIVSFIRCAKVYGKEMKYKEFNTYEHAKLLLRSREQKEHI